MKINHLSGYLETELSYPTDQSAVLEQIGSVVIDAPDADETETVSTIIEPLGEQRYDCPEELFETILGNVSDEYIGRKFYDDRGANPMETPLGPADETDVSF